jgi:hypothetical protein
LGAYFALSALNSACGDMKNYITKIPRDRYLSM